MNKFKKIGAIICICSILVTRICFCCSYYAVKEKLVDTQNELALIQNKLDTEGEKFDSVNSKLSETQEELNRANELITSREGEIYFVDCEVTEYEIDMLAKTVWGEARGVSTFQQSMVVWCILNRVDAGRGTIAQVITAPGQFHGYSSDFPVTNEIKALCKDVVARWKLEKVCSGSVGRTLPPEYLYFRSDSTGLGNVFRTQWDGNYKVWDCNCWNPYS